MSVKRQTIKAEGLGVAITGILQEVTTASDTAMHYAVDKTAAETAKTIRGGAPVRKRGRSHGYNMSWTHKVEKASRMVYQRVVYSRKPSLPHLLQWGHGGPIPAGPIPHIPEDSETEAVFIQNMETALNKGL